MAPSVSEKDNGMENGDIDSQSLTTIADAIITSSSYNPPSTIEEMTVSSVIEATQAIEDSFSEARGDFFSRPFLRRLSEPLSGSGSFFSEATCVDTSLPVLSDLGAEVTVCDNGVEERHEEVHVVPNVTETCKKNVDDMESNLNIPTAEYSRRISYEEMVHQEGDSSVMNVGSNGCDSNILSEDPSTGQGTPSMEKCLVVLTQWALTLQNVYEENQTSLNLSSKCQCHKAESLIFELRETEKQYYEVIELCDNAAINPNMSCTQSNSIEYLAKRIQVVQESLRSAVSIRISNPSSDICNKASYLVNEVCDVRQYVRDATDSLVQLINDLMNIEGCRSHQINAKNLNHDFEETHKSEKIDEEEDMCLGVAGLNTSDDQEMQDPDDNIEEEEEAEDKENEISGRKRKNQKKSPVTSPTPSPSKRARRGRCLSAPALISDDSGILNLLDTKRKAMRAHGLYQYVLWRQAWKAERERNVANSFQ